jgi:hypothetical protein
VLALGELSFGQNTAALTDVSVAEVSGTRDRVKGDGSFGARISFQDNRGLCSIDDGLEVFDRSETVTARDPSIDSPRVPHPNGLSG